MTIEAGYKADALTRSPVLYYDFDEPNGTVPVNSGSHTATALAMSGGAFTSGAALFGTAANTSMANTASRWPYVPYNANLQLPNTGFTIEFVARIDSSAGGIVAQYNTTVTGGFMIWTSGNFLQVGVLKNSVFPLYTSSLATVGDGLRHHYAMTWDGTSVRLYIDGVQRAFGTPASGYQPPTTNGYLAFKKLADTLTTPNNDSFTGRMSHFAAYKTAFSASLVATRYALTNNTAPATPAISLLGYASTTNDALIQWNSVSDETYTVQRSTAADFSANLATGVISGLPTSSVTVGFGAGQFGSAQVAGTTYYFRMKASKPGLESAWSNTVSGTVPAAPPPPVVPSITLLDWITIEGEIAALIEWNAISTESYIVERSLTSNFASPSESLEYGGFPDESVVVAYGLDEFGSSNIENTFYYFRMKSISGGVESAWSNTVSGTAVVSGPPPLDPPYEGQPLLSSLNRIAYLDGSHGEGAVAYALTGIPGISLVAALNLMAGTQGLELDGVLNVIAGTTGLSADEAARRII
jgi:hypothetical protein